MHLFKKLILVSCFLPLFSKSQTPDKYEVHKKILSDNCIGGKGNSTFKISLPLLERILINKQEKKTFEKTLPHFVNDGKVNFSYNENTKEHDLPEYEITYDFLKNGALNGRAIITIKRDINNPISGINIIDITNLQADNLIHSLTTTGYLYRSSISSGGKKYYSNKSKGLEVILARRMDGGFNFLLYKL